MSSNNEETRTYGQWVREQREKLGMNKVELAKRAGLSLAQIYNIEAGRTRNPLPQTRDRIAQAFARAVATEGSVIDLPKKPQEQAPQKDDGALTCSFCKRGLSQVKAIAWTSDERDPTACKYCVDELNSIFAHSDRRRRHDGKAHLQLVPKKTTTGQG